MVATDEDKRRIVQSRNGDHGAFEALIREHQRMIHSLCYRMSGSLADAEDLTQETFIHAFQHLDGFRAEARFSSWLYRIAVNQCLNWQKRKQRLDQLHKEWGEQDRQQSGDDAGLAQQVQEALMKLPAKQRAAVILTTYDGLTHAEAAVALGCSETTVSWRVFAARSKLKRLLKGLGRPDATPMKDTELNEILKRATVPERGADYWEQFPARVTAAIEQRRQAARLEQSSATSPRAVLDGPNIWPWTSAFRSFATKPAFALGVAAVCLALGFVLGFWKGQRGPASDPQLAAVRKYFQEIKPSSPISSRPSSSISRGHTWCWPRSPTCRPRLRST